MERWLPLQDYPGYSASDHGRIRNDKRDTILAISSSKYGRPFVGLWVNNKQVKRNLALLICKTFVPNEREAYFNTPICLDGDLSNCRADNLVWRPRWFAYAHHSQFGKELDGIGPVRNVVTGEVYDDVWEVVVRHGALYMDVVMSIYNSTYVFPLMQRFEWVI